MAEYDTEPIRTTVRRTCQKLAVAAEEAGRATARALEKKGIELKLSELYEELGRLLYKKLRSETGKPINQVSQSKGQKREVGAFTWGGEGG